MALSSQLDISPAASAPLEREREWGYDPSLRRVGMSPDCHWIANQAAVSSPRSVPRGSLYHDTDQAGPTTRHGNLHTISQQPRPRLSCRDAGPKSRQAKPSQAGALALLGLAVFTRVMRHTREERILIGPILTTTTSPTTSSQNSIVEAIIR